jgi:hypothetical protein
MTNYRTRGAAGYLGASKSWLDKQAVKKMGPAYRKVGRNRVYEEEDLEAYKRATRIEPENRQAESTTRST